MKIVVSLYVSPNYFILLIVSSLFCIFNRCAVCFQSLMNIACRSSQKAPRIKRFWRLHIVIKPSNKNRHNKFFTMLKRITLLIFTIDFGACQKWEPASRIGDFGNFLTVSRWSVVRAFPPATSWIQFLAYRLLFYIPNEVRH